MDYNTVIDWMSKNVTTVVLAALLIIVLLLYYFRGRPKQPMPEEKHPITPIRSIPPGNAEFNVLGPSLSSFEEALASERQCILDEIESNKQHYAQARKVIAETTIEARRLEFHIKDLQARLDRYNTQLGVGR